MAFLFDTNAFSEAFRERPNPGFARWLRGLPVNEQFTSAIVVAELYVAAYRSAGAEKWLFRIREAILPVVTVIRFDLDCAHIFGRLQAGLLDRGTPVGAADVIIASTALRYQLTLVTANVRHYDQIPGLGLLTFQPGEAGEFTAP